ncbi:MAG: glycerol kinase GlpK [Acholeplasmatales bacterium]|nr:glycerol kinase GlpK [Acholeplasmatales bacterium]
MKYILTIDQGTTSSRAILFDEKANSVAKYQMEFTQIHRKPGFVEHNANEIYETVIECIKNVLNESNINVIDIAGIALTNQRETAVMFDKAGNPLCDAICWQSKQSEYIAQKLIKEGYEELIYEKTGLHINSYFSATKIKYMLDNNKNVREHYDNNDCLFGTVDTFLLYKLTGGKSYYTDATNASRTLLYNITTLDYDDELLDIFKIKRSILPKVLSNNSCFGFAEIEGVRIPIVSMIGDQQASLFGHTAFNEGEMKNTYGTGCFMLMNTGSTPVFSKNGLLTTIAYMIDGKPTYALEGSVFVAGAAVTWLRDSLRIIQSSKETYERSLKEHGHDLVFVPAFQGLGTPYWDNECKGAMFGISFNTTQESVIKATLEAIAYQAKDLMEEMKKETSLTKISLSVDGGASANDYLLQFESDIMQCVIKRPRQIETTALGAFFIAGLKLNIFDNLAQLRKINEIDKYYYPIMSEEESSSLYSNWQKAVRACMMYK